MQKDTIQYILLGLILAGLLGLGAGLYVLSQDLGMVAERVEEVERKVEERPAASVPVPDEPQQVPPMPDRQVLMTEEANAKLTELIAMAEAGNWNAEYDVSTLDAEPLRLVGRTLHLPYDIDWGNDRYQLDTFEVMDGEYLFGPMYVGEFGGAYRDASIRVRDARTLDAALADPSYSTVGCSGDKTFKPAKVQVRNLEAVRYEGEACEAAWVGYEIRLNNKNVILQSSDEALVRFVLERM